MTVAIPKSERFTHSSAEIRKLRFSKLRCTEGNLVYNQPSGPMHLSPSFSAEPPRQLLPSPQLSSEERITGDHRRPRRCFISRRILRLRPGLRRVIWNVTTIRGKIRWSDGVFLRENCGFITKHKFMVIMCIYIYTWMYISDVMNLGV